MSDDFWPYPRIIAHRCGGALAPENTLAGLHAAAACGCRAVEFDVMLSGDDTPVLIHDETLTRTGGQDLRVASLSLSQRQSVRVGYEWGAGEANEPLPTLAQAAAVCQALGLAANVEIKPSQGTAALTGHIVTMQVAEYWRAARLPPLLSSFHEEALLAARSVAPELWRGLLVDALPSDWAERCLRVGARSIHLSEEHATLEQVRQLRGAGLRVVVYTENCPERAMAWLAAGVTAVISDWPSKMLARQIGGIYP